MFRFGGWRVERVAFGKAENERTTDYTDEAPTIATQPGPPNRQSRQRR